MIYLDTAATSYQKPESVYRRAEEAMRTCANPGRGGHTPSLEAGRMVYTVRAQASDFFGVGDPDRVIFTSNATDSLNLAIHGMARPGGHIVTTSMEHNSVLRPLRALEDRGVRHTIVWGDPVTGVVPPEQMEAAIEPDTCLVICTHVSNVTGTVMPIEAIGAMCRRRGVPFLVDASQSAGIFDLDMTRMPIDLLACPGHKGLLALPGTGLLCLGEQIRPACLKQGGTGSLSERAEQPDLLPDRYESGTLNTVGIASLGAGLAWLAERGLEAIRAHEDALCRRMLEGLARLSGVTVYGPGLEGPRGAVISLQVAGMDCSQAAFTLDREFGICVRSGLHCAPLAHKTMGTFPQGTVRLSLGPFHTDDDVDRALAALARLSAV